MKLRTIKDIKAISGKRVLLRADFNVPIGEDGKVDRFEDERIRRVIPTIGRLMRSGAIVILLAHLGRPGGKYKQDLVMDPVALRLTRLLRRKVRKLDRGQWELPAGVRKGQVFISENLRFHKGEEKNDAMFARKLASIGDVYVNDAFAASHRKHASLVAITRHLPSYAGLLMQEEVESLSRIGKSPKRPFVAVMGGAKAATKSKLIKKLHKEADYVLLGGVIANSFIKSLGIDVGRSRVDPMSVALFRKSGMESGGKLLLPVDVVLATSAKRNAKTRIDAIGNVRKREMILDIGPDTASLYSIAVSHAKTVFWNGPLGLSDVEQFAQGTYDMAESIAGSQAFSVVGGGETVKAIRELGLERQFGFVSTGGGALIEFLEKGMLPGIKPLVR